MKARTFITLSGACVMLMHAFGSFAQTDAPRLQANPFDRPNFIMNLGEAAFAEVVEQRAELTLRATMVTSNGALANINGELVSVGAQIEGYRVARITEGRAVLRSGADELVLDVYQSQRASQLENDSD